MMLETVNLTAKLTDDEFDTRAPKAIKRLVRGVRRLLEADRALVVAFEGWDAAGKGGAIRRLVRPLDPRLYDVHPISAPTAEEKAHHYLWRFWTRLPDPGHIAIFDRTWYGRVLVERIEGFCTEADWRRAYEEIKGFERHLGDEGFVVVKIWLHIDQKTQLERFRAREKDPLRAWKFTPDDLRNREHWGSYLAAIEEMLARTHTEEARWTLVPAVCKPLARLSVIETVAAAIERAL